MTALQRQVVSWLAHGETASMTFGSLFAGIGGLDLGLERAGMTCDWQVEIDPYCLGVLHKHWPGVPKWRDVRTFPPRGIAPGDWYVDLICGGFPCTDISNAGKRAGIDGPQSGLWREFARIVRVLRPRFVLVENVSALLIRGLDRVLGDLAESGYDAEWQCLPAAAVGAPHLRNRVLLLGHAKGQRLEERQGQEGPEQLAAAVGAGASADAESDRCGSRRQGRSTGSGAREAEQAQRETVEHAASLAARSVFGQQGRETERRLSEFRERCRGDEGQWGVEPDVGRVASGVSHRVDRLRGIGNSVVPQVAEFLGRLIMEIPNG